MQDHPMRRKRQELTRERCEEALDRGTSGVLALVGDDYPYAVPLSYVRVGDKLIFHSARRGHKLDAIAENPRASFCVIDQDAVVPEEFTTYFRSVIVFGTVRVVEDEDEKHEAIARLAMKYAPDMDRASREGEISREWRGLCVLEMTIERMSGKEAIELVRARTSAEA